MIMRHPHSPPRIAHGPQGYRALVRYAERVAMRWTPCPVMEALALHAARDVSASTKAIEAGFRAYAAELKNARQTFDAAWEN